MSAQIIRPAQLPGVELFHGTITGRTSIDHVHEGYRFGIALRGAWHTRYRGAGFHVGQGALQLAQPMARSQCDMGAEEQTVLAVTYPPDLMAEVTGRAPGFPDHVLHEPVAGGLLVDAFRRCAEPATRLEPVEALYRACRHIAGHGVALPAEPPRAGIRRARQRIDDDPAGDPSLDELAGLAGMSRFRFARAFRDDVGVAPHAYLVHRRIDVAKGRLARDGYHAGLALELGFYDQSHFIRHFRRQVGLTPRAFAAALRP